MDQINIMQAIARDNKLMGPQAFVLLMLYFIGMSEIAFMLKNIFMKRMDCVFSQLSILLK